VIFALNQEQIRYFRRRKASPQVNTAKALAKSGKKTFFFAQKGQRSVLTEFY
jgi:hypothetical protein